MKYYGNIGYAKTEEISPGVWGETIVERKYFGDIISNTRRTQSQSESINDDVNISNKISIVTDPYAYDNFHSMRYVVFGGTKWKVTNIEVQYPRLILTIGGVYNEQASQTS